MVKSSSEDRDDFVNDSEIESKVVTVGSAQSHKILVVVVILALAGLVYYFYFGSSSEEASTQIINKQEEMKPNVKEPSREFEQIPADVLPDQRIPFLPLPPIIEPQNIPKIEIKAEADPVQINKEPEKPKEKVTNMPILPSALPGRVTDDFPTQFSTITGGGGYPRERRNAQMQVISGASNSDNKSVDVSLANTSAQQGRATKVGRLDLMITQGKIIDAILETAISSDFQGMIRAVVSRDVYAENGDTVLVPKGSKLIGGYSFDYDIAKARINVTWNRILLPHGIDVAISSQVTDRIGRVGVAGIVDNKIANVLLSSFLVTGVSIGAAIVGQKASYWVDKLTVMDMVRSISAKEIDLTPLKGLITGNDNAEAKDKWKMKLGDISKLKSAISEDALLEVFREVLEKLGFQDVKQVTLDHVKQLLTQQVGKSSYESIIEKSVNDLSNDVRDMVKKNIDIKPTVYVDQGTAFKVFVNQDIIFPPQAISYR